MAFADDWRRLKIDFAMRVILQVAKSMQIDVEIRLNDTRVGRKFLGGLSRVPSLIKGQPPRLMQL